MRTLLLVAAAMAGVFMGYMDGAVRSGERAASEVRSALRGDASAVMKSAARSPIMRLGALVLPEMTTGMTDASATLSPSSPCTRRRGSTTAPPSTPIRQVPT